MARHIKILNELEKKKFQYPPFLSSDDRKKIFKFTEWELKSISELRTNSNKVGFILLYNYFKEIKKFYMPQHFNKADITYVAKYLNINIRDISFKKHIKNTYMRYRQLILKKLGIQKYSIRTQKLVLNEALLLCSSRKKTKVIFVGLLDFMRRNKIEIPTYYSISEIISDALKIFEASLIKKIDEHLNRKDKGFFDQLFEFDDKYYDSQNEMSKIKRYKLTLLKKINQSTKPSKIKENIKDLQMLKALFDKLRPFINKLKLSSEVIRYYSQILIKSQIFQIKRRDKNKYLLIICFIINQYYSLNDILIEKLIQTTQSNTNSCLKIHKENFYKDRYNKQELFKDSINSTHTSSDGQKYIIAVDSLNSNFSFKYFGKGKGVSVYSFIDGSHRLFYSTVISSSEREASYVIDGLLYNDVVESDMHSTDTHGYSEIIFGITHFIGVTFAPRIKNFKDQRLYGFENKSC